MIALLSSIPLTGNSWADYIIIAGSVLTALAGIYRYGLVPLYHNVLHPSTRAIKIAVAAAPEIVDLMRDGNQRLEQAAKTINRVQQGLNENTVELDSLHNKVDSLTDSQQVLTEKIETLEKKA